MTDREYIIVLQEWAVQTGVDMSTDSMKMNTGQESIKPGTTMPMEQKMMDRDYKTSPQVFNINPMSMDFNYFTMNGKVFPETAPLRVRYGENVRIRLGNLSMDSHPIDLHGHEFTVVASDGRNIPMLWFKNTINVAPGRLGISSSKRTTQVCGRFIATSPTIQRMNIRQIWAECSQW